MGLLRGIIVGFIIMIGWNMFFLYTAMGVDDPLVESYKTEAR